MSRIVVRGVVVPGDQRGRELGFPTANVVIPDVLGAVVEDGVFAGVVTFPDGRAIPAAVSVGTRPMFYGSDGVRLLEAHLLDFSDDIYGLEIGVEIREPLREQRMFDDLPALIHQMQLDVERCRELAGHLARPRS